MTDYPREVRWFLCKYIPDLERMEPRNVGVILHAADAPISWRFLDGPTSKVPFGAPEEEVYRAQVAKWEGILEKYGDTCLRWIGKRSKKTPRFYIELGGGRIVGGRVVLDALFERLVL